MIRYISCCCSLCCISNMVAAQEVFADSGIWHLHSHTMVTMGDTKSTRTDTLRITTLTPIDNTILIKTGVWKHIYWGALTATNRAPLMVKLPSTNKSPDKLTHFHWANSTPVVDFWVKLLSSQAPLSCHYMAVCFVAVSKGKMKTGQVSGEARKQSKKQPEWANAVEIKTEGL